MGINGIVRNQINQGLFNWLSCLPSLGVINSVRQLCNWLISLFHIDTH